MKNKQSNTIETVKEIFGRGYDISYRWFRVTELMESYYNLVIVPAIVLGCSTCLMQYLFNYMNTGNLFSTMITIANVFGIIVFYMIIMMIDDFTISLKNWYFEEKNLK